MIGSVESTCLSLDQLETFIDSSPYSVSFNWGFGVYEQEGQDTKL